MKAVQYRTVGGKPEVVEIEKPTPGPGQVLVRVTAAGLCHSDIAVMSWPEEMLSFPLPLTLGHEGVGIVEAFGPGVDTSVEIGESVMVYGPWGCGRCYQCAEGFENYCERVAELRIFPPGLGAPGAMAEYMIVDSPRHLLPIGDLDPVDAAPLTDAGLTPYHAIKTSLTKLGGNSIAVVQGVGGLGHIGIQMIKEMTGARVIAMDIGEDKLNLALEVGADYAFESSEASIAEVRKITNGRGANVVFDFVGIQATVDLGSKLCSARGDWSIVGIGGGFASVGFGSLPYECSVYSPYWGTRSDLIEVINMAQRGVITIHKETFGIDEAPAAYERLHHRDVKGRAVIVM